MIGRVGITAVCIQATTSLITFDEKAGYYMAVTLMRDAHGVDWRFEGTSRYLNQALAYSLEALAAGMTKAEAEMVP